MSSTSMRRHGVIFLLSILISAGFFGFLVGEKRLERALELKASSILATTVEIDNLKIYLPRPGISFDSLRIVDTYEPKVNLVHTGRVAFFLDVPALLERKIVIHELAVNDVRIGTARTRAAKIVEKRADWPPWLRKAEAHLHGQITPPPRFDADPRNMPLARLVPVLELPFSSTMERINVEADSARRKWQQSLLEIANSVSQINSLGQMTETDLEFKQSAIEKARLSIPTLRQQMERGVESLSATLSSIEKASLLNLDGAQESEVPIRVNPQVMAQMMFGKTLHQVTMRLLRLVAVSRRYIPPNAAAGPGEGSSNKAGHSGWDVPYGAGGSQPSFLIEHIFVQSDSSLMPTRKVNRNEGKILGITSQPEVFGTPLTFDINAIFTDPRSVSFSGSLDHTSEIPRARLEYDGSGFNQRDLWLPRRSYLPSKIVFKRGTTDGLMEVAGDSIRLFLSVYINPVAFDFQDVANGSSITERVRTRLDSSSRFSLFCEVSGRLDTPDMYIESSIDKIVADVMQAYLFEWIASNKSDLEVKIGELLESQKDEARNVIRSNEREIMSKLTNHERTLDEATEFLKIRKQELRGHDPN